MTPRSSVVIECYCKPISWIVWVISWLKFNIIKCHNHSVYVEISLHPRIVSNLSFMFTFICHKGGHLRQSANRWNKSHCLWQAVWDSNPNNKLYKIFPKLQRFSPLHQSYTRKDQTFKYSSLFTLPLLTHTFLIINKEQPPPVTIVNAS